MYLEEEDIELTFTGYRFIQTRHYIYYFACVLTGGILFLLGRWMPQRYLAFVAERCEMSQAESVVVEVRRLFTFVNYRPPHDPIDFQSVHPLSLSFFASRDTPRQPPISCVGYYKFARNQTHYVQCLINYFLYPMNDLSLGCLWPIGHGGRLHKVLWRPYQLSLQS